MVLGIAADSLKTDLTAVCLLRAQCIFPQVIGYFSASDQGDFRLMGGSGGTGKGIIAERLDTLFTTMNPEGPPYTLREAAEGINQQVGRNVVTSQYLSRLRRGLQKNPSFEKLQAIANWFGVRVDYFVESKAARSVDEETRLLEALRDPLVLRLALMTEDVEPEHLDLVVRMLKEIRKADGLPPVLDGRVEELGRHHLTVGGSPTCSSSYRTVRDALAFRYARAGCRLMTC